MANLVLELIFNLKPIEPRLCRDIDLVRGMFFIYNSVTDTGYSKDAGVTTVVPIKEGEEYCSGGRALRDRDKKSGRDIFSPRYSSLMVKFFVVFLILFLRSGHSGGVFPPLRARCC